ncbi:RICIN domain-containing protein [Micromonospora sp. STR1_7]|uniref:RICIN domain-containing protein n=1 Tax=Micromonospora parastrephiae TaxID=2806101 RepID=A0ABS1XNL9_9ACTN|nr:RICIN domain-containing protein [Micromonospora parastrephiae]MBM0230839.1 RICIN domain-containing protein [Micromonospora parastrephiae]
MNILSRTSVVLTVCVGLVAASLVVASPASAATEYSFRSESSATSEHPFGSLCIDVSYASTANGTAIKQWPCDGGPAQKWTIVFEGRWDGVVYYQLVSSLWSPDGPKCLDLPWGNPAAGQTLQLWDCLGVARQLWSVTQVPGSNGYALRNLQTGQCVDVPWGDPIAGNAVWQWTCNNTAAQQWNLRAW